MSKKQFWIIVDTETTADGKVFDFGAVVIDRQGNIHNQCSIIVKEEINSELFYDPNAQKGELWTKEYAETKKAKYAEMVNNGSRSIASVNAVNRWLEKVNAKYNPTLTAYNIGFDAGKCANTGIDLNMFESRFCLWHIACAIFANKKQYKQFILENAYIGNRTKFGNMTIKTNAEVMAHYIMGRYNEEPHTAIEDAINFELPILVAVLKKRDYKDYIGIAYNWKDYQLKDHYNPK